MDDMHRAATVLIVRDGKVLSVSRGNDLSDWALPGGKLRIEETYEEGAVRETVEETGLAIFGLELVFERQNETFHVQTFRPKRYYGEIRSSDEGEVRWLDPIELTTGTFSDYNRELFGKVGLL
jgi:ADP-ribose pyrophosphatase YjhB (NUDIX family)